MTASLAATTLEVTRNPLIATSVASVSQTEFSVVKKSGLDNTPTFPIYRPFHVQRTFGSQADFDTPTAGKKIAAVLSAVVAEEGPIAFFVACRRVAAHWGFKKATGRVQDIVRTHIVNAGLQIHKSGDIDFLWVRDVVPSNYNTFRINGQDRETSRTAIEIPLEEFANGILHLLDTNFGMPADDLCTATARLFGFQRTGVEVANRIELAIQHLQKNNRIVNRNGTLSLL